MSINNLNEYYYKAKYWTRRQFGYIKGGKQKRQSSKNRWDTLSHNGPLLPPDYTPHNIPIIYDNEKVYLEQDAEEAATLYAKYLDTEYINNKTFIRNFWKDWKKILGHDHKIKSFEYCNFKLIYDHLLQEKETRKLLTHEEKQQLKKKKSDEEKKYIIAIVNGQSQAVGNFRLEPPGIYIGRGCNPLQGKIKRRLIPEDIVINIGKDANVPIPPDGHKWKKVIHDRKVVWLCSYPDTINNKTKYIWLGATSSFKAESDIKKFNLARKLKKKIGVIRDANFINMKHHDKSVRQIATALYFIDKLALRVGNEKGKDAADTVGVVSLRTEHIKLGNSNKITLDFLGKDAIRYVKTIQVDAIVYKNLQEFTKNKHKKTQLFDVINTDDLNKYLQTFLKGLTAKVFRTYNASNLFQKELNKISKKYDTMELDNKINILLMEFSKANAKVALLCNHQKKVSSSHDKQVEKINEMIKKERRKIKKLHNSLKKNKTDKINKMREQIKKLKAKRSLKIEMKGVALGTSKANYIDPRITISFMKKHQLPIEKILEPALQDKFKWAFDVGTDFKF